MTPGDRSRPQLLLSLLLVAAAVLFVVGVVAERHVADTHTDLQDAGTTHVEGSDETAEAPAEGVGPSTSVEPTAETVFGIDLESTGLAIAAVTASVALALLAWRTKKRVVVLAIAAFALAFTVLDVAELAHQIKESRTGLATLAAAIALAHVAVFAVAVVDQHSSSY